MAVDYELTEEQVGEFAFWTGSYKVELFLKDIHIHRYDHFVWSPFYKHSRWVTD